MDNLEELDEATNFLHENGILLHYDEGSVLSDIYFLDPQWLCSNLAEVVTVREDIASHKYGTFKVTFIRACNIRTILSNLLSFYHITATEILHQIFNQRAVYWVWQHHMWY